MIYIQDYLKKTIRAYATIVDRINADTKDDLTKTLIVFLVFIICFLFFKSPLAAVAGASAVAVIAFRWDSRVFIGIALLFLATCPILLIFRDTYWAKEMARYGYYLLGVAILVQVVQQVMHPSIVVQKSSESHVNVVTQRVGFFFLLALVLMGFFYLFFTLNARITKQQALIQHLGGGSLEIGAQKDQELVALKKQLQDAIDIVSSNAQQQDSKIVVDIEDANGGDVDTEGELEITLTPSEDPIDPKDITLDILNGTQVVGAAARLRDELGEKGYQVLSIGDEGSKEFTRTIVKYREGQEGKAQKVVQELEDTFTVVLEKDETIMHDILVIIGRAE